MIYSQFFTRIEIDLMIVGYHGEFVRGCLVSEEFKNSKNLFCNFTGIFRYHCQTNSDSDEGDAERQTLVNRIISLEPVKMESIINTARHDLTHLVSPRSLNCTHKAAAAAAAIWLQSASD